MGLLAQLVIGIRFALAVGREGGGLFVFFSVPLRRLFAWELPFLFGGFGLLNGLGIECVVELGFGVKR
ncbi:hypothetical protein, partial [Bilophila wadsworthia]|uniref:hypothetical protein n=1 Tax=Bilophila wadsworthia TaxID=35833 RepID=UPI0026748109